jgi:hypothetical protein
MSLQCGLDFGDALHTGLHLSIFRWTHGLPIARNTYATDGKSFQGLQQYPGTLKSGRKLTVIFAVALRCMDLNFESEGNLSFSGVRRRTKNRHQAKDGRAIWRPGFSAVSEISSLNASIPVLVHARIIQCRRIGPKSECSWIGFEIARVPGFGHRPGTGAQR